jgi:hypothetical protein
MRRLLVAPLILALTVLTIVVSVPAASAGGQNYAPSLTWTKIYGDNPSGWTGRAGLQAVELRDRLFVMGGRTPAPTQFNPFASLLWNDVWASGDLGVTWNSLGTAPWAPRAYFQAVTKGDAMFVLGGQDLGGAPPAPPTQFFNDVWTSRDGVSWQLLTEHAPWQARAGLSAIVFKGWIYVMAGSNGDDVAIGGSGRVLLNDVWRSRDGQSWELVTGAAPWPARAGAAVVEKNGYLYLLGGEDGFLCTVGPAGLQCPYFNDVWRSRDGATWELVTPSAGWSARPGLQSQVLGDTIIVFGGFGWPSPANPGLPPGPGNALLPGHPTDQWASRDGNNWTKLSGSPWNAASSADVKYDFDSLVVRSGPFGLRQSILTFGGDREISFASPDPTIVDDDVWRATLRLLPL